MTEIVTRALGLVGETDSPYAGRIALRLFPHGAAEAVYVSSRGPSEAETLNAWFHDAGIDNRVTARDLGGGWSDQSVRGPRRDGELPETHQHRVARRARQRVRWSAKCIGADRLLTLTYRSNQEDFDLAKRHLAKFTAMCRRRWPDFKFVAVPERQERGAWHWHLAIRGWLDITVVRGFWWRVLGARVHWSDAGKPVLLDDAVTPGNVDVTTPRTRGRSRRVWHVDNLSAYLSKYISKAICGGLDGRASYSASRGLQWQVERYVVRAQSFVGVVKVFFETLQASSVRIVRHYQSDDLTTLWAAGSRSTAESVG